MQTEISKINDPVRRMFAFIKERHSIYTKRASGAKPPWTKDPILANFRFCNVYRELDKVTVWIAQNWRIPNYEDKDLWFGMCVARLQNQPDALKALGWPVPWNAKRYLSRLRAHKEKGNRVFNAAYIVSTNGIAKDKLQYLADDVLSPLWEARERMRPKAGDTLNSYHMLLGQMQGFGSFMSAQVIADLKYHAPLNDAKDWWTFAASGPGSRRGLNFLLGRDRKAPWDEDDWRMRVERLRLDLADMIGEAKLPRLHGQDMQNCLCEYSKYHRAVTEGKKPKQRYRAGE